MDLLIIFGYTATALCIASFLFQNYEIYKNKSANDVSYKFIVLQFIVNLFYWIYNTDIINMPGIINSAVTAALSLAMGGQKYYYNKYYSNGIVLDNNNVDDTPNIVNDNDNYHVDDTPNIVNDNDNNNDNNNDNDDYYDNDQLLDREEV